jgi:hypothetical protein
MAGSALRKPVRKKRPAARQPPPTSCLGLTTIGLPDLSPRGIDFFGDLARHKASDCLRQSFHWPGVACARSHSAMPFSRAAIRFSRLFRVICATVCTSATTGPVYVTAVGVRPAMPTALVARFSPRSGVVRR